MRKPQQFDRNEVSVETNGQVTSFSTDVKFQFGFKVSRRLRVLNLVLQIPQDLSYQTNKNLNLQGWRCSSENVRPVWMAKQAAHPTWDAAPTFQWKNLFLKCRVWGWHWNHCHSILAKEQMQYGSDFPVSQPSSALRKPLALMMVTSISMALWFPRRRQSGHLRHE